MKLYHVVAMANNRVIGKDNKLPWHFSSDLKFFKQLTTGHAILMGRKTYESIGRPLPNRTNYVLSRTLTESAFDLGKEVIVSQSLESLTNNYFTGAGQVFIIGGAEIFRQTMDKIDGIYLTHINADYEGDTFYPEIPPNFQEKSRTELQMNPKIEVVFYERK